MKATEANFLRFMQGSKQFVIPIYQRTYSWTQKQCKQLWDDIVRVATQDDIPAHFIGSIVYIEGGIYQVSAVPELLVIDGQQRLTTLTLLLVAIAREIEKGAVEIGVSAGKIVGEHLINIHEEDEGRFKLLLTQSDENTLKQVVAGKELHDKASVRIVENFQFFEKQIQQAKIPLEVIYKGLMKLVIVDVSLDRSQDNPQLIFESLNSTGLDLSQADLIRNFILMGLPTDEQKNLYQDYWYPMERSFGQKEYTKLFDQFMRHYLTIKNKGTIPKINEVYEQFKIFVRKNKDSNIEQIVADIYRYSKHYIPLVFWLTAEEKLQAVLHDISVLRVETAHPFLMEVLEDFQQGLITIDEVLQVFRILESYVFRRVVCGIPTNSLNKTFANLSREVDKENYVKSLVAAFSLKDSYRRFPSDEEFRREFVVKDVYNFRSRNYLLRKLENYDRKEKVSIEEYTIEHILPQNEKLSIGWQKMLGEDWQKIQERNLHTIGNLTLTGYNTELSDRPFIEKRDMKGGFADSPIRLNQFMSSLDHWNEDTIIERAKELEKKALAIWQPLSISDEQLKLYQEHFLSKKEDQYSLDDFEYLVGDIQELFNIVRRRILNLDASVKEEYKKLYIAYKTTTNFVDIVPQKSRLRLSLNMAFQEIDDPKGLCKDVSTVGRWGNGDVEVGISSADEIEDIMFLINQSFEKHWDGENGELY